MNQITEFLLRNRQKKLKIHCVGDAMVDEYYKIKVDRISPEFPMPLFLSENDGHVSKPGGIANVAHNLKHFNVDATLVSFIDPHAKKVFNQHNLKQLDVTYVNSKLPIKRRYLDGDTQIIRHDIETKFCGLNVESISHFGKELSKIITDDLDLDVVILSDYGKGFFSGYINILNDVYKNYTTIVDPKYGPLEQWRGCKIFKPNSKEAAELSGYECWQDQASHLQYILGCESVVITFGGEKVVGIYKDEHFIYQPKRSVSPRSLVGAGDCFCAIFAMAVAHNFEVPDAAKIAFEAGAAYVQKTMNSPIMPCDMAQDKLIDPEDLAVRDHKLVFTNGCFDVLHEGHVSSLKFAKSKGDKLVVALNSDDSVRRLKGEGRPINSLSSRISVVAALGMVDYVVSFEEDIPAELLEIIKPDVYVKGDEYKNFKGFLPTDISEVHFNPMVPGVNSTNIIEKMKLDEELNCFAVS